MSRPQQRSGSPEHDHPELLHEFLSGHDASCPVCGYSLRGLTTTICPECSQPLSLTVGVRRLRLGWLFVALTPGMFSSLAACVLLFPTIGIYMEDGILLPPFVFGVLFGWGSGAFALLFLIRKNRFLRQPRERQPWLALGVWAVHATALVVFVVLLAPHWS